MVHFFEGKAANIATIWYVDCHFFSTSFEAPQTWTCVLCPGSSFGKERSPFCTSQSLHLGNLAREWCEPLSMTSIGVGNPQLIHSCVFQVTVCYFADIGAPWRSILTCFIAMFPMGLKWDSWIMSYYVIFYSFFVCVRIRSLSRYFFATYSYRHTLQRRNPLKNLRVDCTFGEDSSRWLSTYRL